MIDLFGLRTLDLFALLSVGFFNLMQAYIILIMADFIWGLIRCGKQGRMKSASMRNGIFCSVGEAVIVLVCSSIVAIYPAIENLVGFLILSLILKELVSISENLKAIGVKIPKCFDRLLDETNDKFDNTNIKDKFDNK